MWIAPNRRRSLPGNIAFIFIKFIPPGPERAIAAPRRFLPLRFGRQANFDTCLPTEPLTVGEGILARYAHNGVVKPLLKWCFSQLIPDRFTETIQLALRPITGLIDKLLELPVGHRVFRNGVFRKIDLSLWLLARKPLIRKFGVKLLDAVVLRCLRPP